MHGNVFSNADICSHVVRDNKCFPLFIIIHSVVLHCLSSAGWFLGNLFVCIELLLRFWMQQYCHFVFYVVGFKSENDSIFIINYIIYLFIYYYYHYLVVVKVIIQIIICMFIIIIVNNNNNSILIIIIIISVFKFIITICRIFYDFMKFI